MMDSAVALLHASMPPASTMAAAWSMISMVRGCSSPVAVAADAPVGPAGNHVAQACLSVLGVEAGFLNGGQRQLAQRLLCLVFGEYAHAFVHAHKPLRGGAVDHR